MKKLISLIIFSFLYNLSANAETWTCDNYRFGKSIYEVAEKEVVLKFPNNDGRNFVITKDYREQKVSIFGEKSNKETKFDYDIYMDYQDKYVINRTLDAVYGFSRSYTDNNCEIFYK